MRYILAGLFFLISGCTLLFEKRCQDITVTSNPPGAYILINEDFTGFVTPAKLCVPKGESAVIALSKEGFYEKRMIAYNTVRRTDLSDPCKYDIFFGWFMLIPIPVLIAKSSKRCHFFHKQEFSEDLVEIENYQPKKESKMFKSQAM